MIDKRIPRNLEGKPFVPYWFSDTSLSVTKKEKEDFSKCDGARANLHVSQERNIISPSHGHLHLTSESYNGLSTGDGITEKESDQLGLPVTLAITLSPPKLVQSWIDNQKSASPSSIESSSSLFSTDNPQLVSSSKTVDPPGKNRSSKKTYMLRFANEGELESKISTVNDSSSTKEKTYSNRKRSESESELECGRDTLVRESVKTSPLTIVEESDVEVVSSSTTASSTRVQPRSNPCKYLMTDGVLKIDKQSSESDNDSRGLTPKLGGDNELAKVRTNTRCKKKKYQISSSSDNLSTAASSSGSSPKKKKKKALVTIESDSESPNDKFNIDPVGRLDGTPPIEEPPSSNYQTPIQEEQHVIPADEFKTNFRKAAIKRKLYMDEQTVNSPKSKRIPLDSVQNGRTVLPKIIEMLKKHSNNLRTRDRFAAKHCEELDRCIEDVFFSHQRVNQNLTDDQLDTAIVDKVKLGYIS